MRPPTGWLLAALLTTVSITEAQGSGAPRFDDLDSAGPPVDADSILTYPNGQAAGPTRLHLVTYPGSFRIFPPYPAPIDPFSTPWSHLEDRFGIAGAFDVWQSAHWRVGVQVEGIYNRYDLPLAAARIARWRRRIVIYGTYIHDGWHTTLGVVIHDTGPQERLKNVLAAKSHGAWADLADALAHRQTGHVRPAGVRRPARDMSKVRPQDDVLDPPAGRKGRRAPTGVARRIWQ